MLNKHKRDGFTIVELIIVIVVIGILATLVLVAFGAIQTRAIKTVAKSDASSAASELEIFKHTSSNSRYPTQESQVNNGSGLSKSEDTSYQYTFTSSTNSYCLTTYSLRSPDVTYMITNTNTSPVEGVCPNHMVAAEVIELNGSTVTTVAGTGAYGYAEGPSETAVFNNPWGVRAASDGTLYVSDTLNHRVRKIATDGTVSTFAGTSLNTVPDGTVATVRLSSPQDVVLDGSNNVYIAETNLVSRVTQDGYITTVAGSTTSGYADGNGTSARFRRIGGLVFGADGTLFVSDTNNDRIRKISPSGDVTTFAGGTRGNLDGEGTNAQFYSPAKIDLDDAGNLYVSDYNNHRIRKITPSGTVTTLAGSSMGLANGNGTSARFYRPEGLAVTGDGTVYVADTYNCRIRKITPAGDVSTIAGTLCGYADGSGLTARFYMPQSISIYQDNTLFVSDAGNSRIRKVEL